MLYQNLRSKDFFSKFSMDLLLAEDVVFSIDMHSGSPRLALSSTWQKAESRSKDL